jgi:hypothetical protein
MRDWRQRLAAAGLMLAVTGWPAVPALAEEDVGPIGCAITYRQLNTLREEALQPATIRKRQIKDFEPFDFAARDAKIMELVEADPELDRETIESLYFLVAMSSTGGFTSNFGMDLDAIVSTLKEGAKCDAHYEFSPDSGDLLVHFQ